MWIKSIEVLLIVVHSTIWGSVLWLHFMDLSLANEIKLKSIFILNKFLTVIQNLEEAYLFIFNFIYWNVHFNLGEGKDFKFLVMY